jgi:hypothetical protein
LCRGRLAARGGPWRRSEGARAAPRLLQAGSTGTLKSGAADRSLASAAAEAVAGSGGGSPSFRRPPSAPGSGTVRAASAATYQQQQQQQQQGYGGTLRSAAQPGGYGGTVRVARDGPGAAAPAQQYGTVRVNGAADAFGTVRVAGGGRSSAGGAPAPGPAPAKQAASRLASLKQLQVDVPSPSSGQPEVAIVVSKLQRSEANSAQSSALLRGVVAPALRNVAAQEPGAADAVQDLQEQLAAVEKQLPGSCYRLVYELLLQLSISESQAVQGLKEEGGRLLGGLAGGQPEEQGRRALELGPLGDFLLARWREEVARQQTGPAR